MQAGLEADHAGEGLEVSRSAPVGSPALGEALQAASERREAPAVPASRARGRARRRLPVAGGFSTAACRRSRVGDGSCSPAARQGHGLF